MDAPKCRLCQRNHWQSVACNGIPHAEQRKPTGAENAKAGARPSGSPKRKHPAEATIEPATNTRREGRRVLKGSTGKPAKPTRSAATAKANPPKAKKAKGGERPTHEPIVREPGATAGPVKKAKPRRVK